MKSLLNNLKALGLVLTICLDTALSTAADVSVSTSTAEDNI